jgi:hypothetical protein
MSKQKLTIATTLTVDDKPVPGSPVSRDIWVDSACSFTLTAPKNAPACKSCFCVNAGPKSLLKFVLLVPKPQIPPAPPAAQGQQSPPHPTPEEILKLHGGLTFYTSDSYGHSDPVPLTGAQIYTDAPLASLFGKDQQQLEKLIFTNPTGYCIDVTVIIGRDYTPCVEDDSDGCGDPAQATR